MAVYTDDFNRANAGSLGSPWSDIAGVWNIDTNAAKSTTEDLANFSMYVQTYSNDQYSKATYVTNATSYAAVGVRMSFSGGVIAYVLFVNPSGAGWDLQEYPAGSSLASGADTFSNGDIMEVRAVGTTISAWKNGVQIGSATDATIASGNAGIGAYQVGDVAEVFIDDWEGGDIGGSSTANLLSGKFGGLLKGKL
jgi:hypothetical protein